MGYQSRNHSILYFYSASRHIMELFNFGKQEQDDAFSYLDRMAEYDHFTNHFFNVRFPELNVRYLSDQAFKYVTNCLLKVNTKIGRLCSVCSKVFYLIFVKVKIVIIITFN